MARKSVDVDQELDENTGDGEFESERGGFNGSNRRSAPGMKAFVGSVPAEGEMTP